MTITDNYDVFSCPHCKAESCEQEIGSYNTIGGVWWSDCFYNAPMAPSPYIVTRCWKCHKAFCRYQATMKTVSDREYEADGKSVHMVEWVGDYDVLKEVLDGGNLDPDTELNVLMQLVWAGNHKDRIAGCMSDDARRVCAGLKAVEMSPEELQSYRMRAASMTITPLWLRAELHREMGGFDEAKAALEKFKQDHPDKYGSSIKYVEAVNARIVEKSRKVFER